MTKHKTNETATISIDIAHFIWAFAKSNLTDEEIIRMNEFITRYSELTSSQRRQLTSVSLVVNARD